MTRAELEDALASVLAVSRGWALAQTRWNAAEADDVLQATVLKLIDGRARFDGRSSFRSFVFGVIRQTARERRRREWVRGLILSRPAARAEAAPRGGDAPSPEARLALSRESARLAAALAQLPERQREILHLVFYGELTIEEAARVAGVALGTARTHYARGKQRLRALLPDLAPEGGAHD
ncbi:MAG TPA: RNA polymerase sigma factor [Myxococcota bacterium]|jgi:RNA polymerase sigma-70 factor (ECF subfamily)